MGLAEALLAEGYCASKARQGTLLFMLCTMKSKDPCSSAELSRLGHSCQIQNPKPLGFVLNFASSDSLLCSDEGKKN